MSQLDNLSVALVYDKLNTPYGGAEHVLQVLHDIFPDAPLYTSVYDKNKASWARIFTVYTSFLQKIPLIKHCYPLVTLLNPLAFESFNLDQNDLVISITSAEAKGVITKPNQLHICYMLTPPRYLYTHQKRYLDSHWYTRLPGLRQLAILLLTYQEWWDTVSAFRPDYIIPISNLVKARVEKFYKRDAEEVIYPPVPAIQDTANATTTKATNTALPIQKYYLSVSRLVAYKRLDLAIQACLQLHRKLVIVGTGNEQTKLMQLAGKQAVVRHEHESLRSFFKRAAANKALIFFTNTVSNHELKTLMENSTALIMPGVEDFGITALQAGQLGKPVIVHQESGSAELLEDGKHGMLLPTESVEALITAIKKLESATFDAKTITHNANKQRAESFTTQFRKKVYDLFISYQQNT